MCVTPHTTSVPSTAVRSRYSAASRVTSGPGRPVPTGERGEVVIRGPNVMKGYYNRPDATADVMRNGWFHSGDIGTLTSNDSLTVHRIEPNEHYLSPTGQRLRASVLRRIAAAQARHVAAGCVLRMQVCG